MVCGKQLSNTLFKKCQLINFTHARRKEDTSTFTINWQWRNTIKQLGFKIYNNLRFEQHIVSLCKHSTPLTIFLILKIIKMFHNNYISISILWFNRPQINLWATETDLSSYLGNWNSSTIKNVFILQKKLLYELPY